MGELKIERTVGIRVLHNGELLWSGEKTPGIEDMVDEIHSRKLYDHTTNGFFDGRNWIAPAVLSLDCMAPPTIVTSEDVETFLHEVISSPFTVGLLSLSGSWNDGMHTKYYKVFPGQFVRVWSGEVYNVESIDELCVSCGAVNVQAILSMPNAQTHRGEYVSQAIERELAMEELFG